MTDRELDALMQRVLLDSLKLGWEKRLHQDHLFISSPRYKRAVSAMLANPLAWEHKRAAPIWKKVTCRIAVVVLIISLGFSGLLAASPSVRAVFLQWITEWYETHIVYRYSGADTVGVMPRYEITQLPEGYAEVESERIEWPNQVDIVYRNEKTGKTIYLNYVQMHQGSASGFEIINDSEIIPVTVNGLDGQLFWGADWENEWNTVTWIDPDNGLQFSIDACLDKMDILHAAESVSLVKSTK